jgi:hypothetical protein
MRMLLFRFGVRGCKCDSMVISEGEDPGKIYSDRADKS